MYVTDASAVDSFFPLCSFHCTVIASASCNNEGNLNFDETAECSITVTINIRAHVHCKQKKNNITTKSVRYPSIAMDIPSFG